MIDVELARAVVAALAVLAPFYLGAAVVWAAGAGELDKRFPPRPGAPKSQAATFRSRKVHGRQQLND